MNDLRGDCARCAALCCVALHFDKGAMFAFDKRAGEPCRHLGDNHLCTIHERLEQTGFTGCARYDCYGAGQLVTQEVFAGRSWRDDPDLLEPMLHAFADLREVQETLLLLREASKLQLNEPDRARLIALQSALSPADGWSQETVANGVRTSKEARAFIATLRIYVERTSS